MPALGALFIGVLNIVIWVVILVLVGAIVVWVLGLLGWPIPWNIQRLYLAVVALVALTMFVALLLGVGPHWHFVTGHGLLLQA